MGISIVTSASGHWRGKVTAAAPKLFTQHGRRTRCGIHGSPLSDQK